MSANMNSGFYKTKNIKREFNCNTVFDVAIILYQQLSMGRIGLNGKVFSHFRDARRRKLSDLFSLVKRLLVITPIQKVLAIKVTF